MAETETGAVAIGSQDYARVCSLLLGGRYELIQEVKASAGTRRISIGRKFECRYCDNRGAAHFRKIAHTFPESLGNKWVFSQDECDACNERFSLYEDSLAKAVSPFLTLGGVKGKGNKVRQTGRTGGMSTLERRQSVTGPAISAVATGFDFNTLASINPSGKFKLNIPIADVPYRPRYAYKALTKMGFGLLPEEELGNYSKLRAWLFDTNDVVDFPILECTMSFGSVGHAPPLVSASILRRVDPAGMHPHILFVFCAGSVCFQIGLLSDHLENHIPPVSNGAIKIQYSVAIGDAIGGRIVTIRYEDPIHLNWSSRTSTPQPIKEIVFDFDSKTLRGSFKPIFRN